MDSIEQIWWLAWTAHALPQGHNILLANGQNYPAGQNFGVNGSMIALGVVFMPITKLFGPVVTFNIAQRLALALSAASMCFVLRRWTTWWPAAFLGGLLYGFSAYALQHTSYLFLNFVPLPPLVFLLLYEILVRQRWRPIKTGVLLGITCVLQFFISTEVFAETAVMSAIACVLFSVVHRNVLVERWRYAVTALASGLGVIFFSLFIPALVTFAGPQHTVGPPFSPSSLSLFPGDLLSPIFPHVATKANFDNGRQLYLGIPMVVALATFAVLFRKRKVILFAGTMAIIAFTLSLGSRLYVNGHQTPIPLPFALFLHLPALNGFLAARFSLFTALFASAMFALGIDQLRSWLGRPSRSSGLRSPAKLASGLVVLALIAVAVVVPLVPNHTEPVASTNVPTFFTSSAVEAIPPGSVVLAYPYPDATSQSWYQGLLPTHTIMLDQAAAGMRFNIIGGYGWFPSPTGQSGTINPSVLEPQSVQILFDALYLGGAETPVQRSLLSRSDLTGDLREFLRKYDVQTVVAIHLDKRSRIRLGETSAVTSYITEAIGPPLDSGGVTVWYHVRKRLAQ